MDYLVVYDIADPKRLRQVACIMEGFGYRVQKSVFECDLSAGGARCMEQKLKQVICWEQDSVRIYPLLARGRSKQTILGCGETSPLEKELCLVI